MTTENDPRFSELYQMIKPRSTPAHTPGPWRVKRNNGELIVGTNGEPLARMLGDSLVGSDARLVAAAPSMLSILETVYARTDNKFLQHEAASGIRLALGDEAYAAWYKDARTLERSNNQCSSGRE